MNKIFDERKISTFRDFKDLVRSNKLIGRREICIVVDRLELENVIYKAEMYDEAKKDYKKRKIVKDKEIDRLNNIINEAKEECKSVIKDSEHTTASEFNINGLMRTILKILNKGDKNE